MECARQFRLWDDRVCVHALSVVLYFNLFFYTQIFCVSRWDRDQRLFHCNGPNKLPSSGQDSILRGGHLFGLFSTGAEPNRRSHEGGGIPGALLAQYDPTLLRCTVARECMPVGECARLFHDGLLGPPPVEALE